MHSGCSVEGPTLPVHAPDQEASCFVTCSSQRKMGSTWTRAAHTWESLVHKMVTDSQPKRWSAPCLTHLGETKTHSIY